MKRFALSCALAFALLPLTTAAQLSCGTATRIDDDWTFSLQDDSAAKQPGYDDRSWQRVTLPHDWSIRAPLDRKLASATGYLPGGIGWYRKTLTIPAREAGDRVLLYFEGVYNRSEVYLNGQLLGVRPNGYVSFYYDATPYVRFDQPNTIAVRVDHSRYADSRWYPGSGIYRDVYLIRTGPVHLAPWGVFVRTEQADANAARLVVDAEIRNDSTAEAAVVVTHELLRADGTPEAKATTDVTVAAGTAEVARSTLSVDHPQLWSVEHPALYQVRTAVARKQGGELDRTLTKTGIRRLSFDPDQGFALNGVGMKLKGVCLHHDAGVLGAAVPPEVWRQRLRALKDLGCTAIRTSHNPQAPVVYDLCDELGLLVLDEAFDEWELPKRKWLQGWNVGEPGFEGSADFFAEWSARDLADQVRRDRNHPSIFAWSIGNEIDYPNDPYSHPVLDQARINQPTIGKYDPKKPNAARLGEIAQRLAGEVRQLDSSRPVSAALAGVVMSNETAYPGALDIVGYNYTEDRYAMDHAKYPRRVIYGSENGHSFEVWKAVRDNPYILGQFLWTGIDYLGEAGRWPSRGSSAGLLDLTGAVKPRGHFRAALWSTHPVAYLGTRPASWGDPASIDARPIWNYDPGTLVRVFCYTNAAKARLVLNGKPVGEEKPHDDTTGVISWEVRYAAGRLEVLALDEHGTEVVRGSMQTAGAASALRVTSDAPTAFGRGAVAILAVQLVDRDGVPVLTSDQDVTCRIDGPARLLGLEAGNLRDMSDYTDSTQRTYHGRLVAYVQGTGGAGGVRVRFACSGVPETEVDLPGR